MCRQLACKFIDDRRPCLIICDYTMKKSAPNRVQKVTTVLHFGTPMPARFAIWEGAPRRTTEPILENRRPKVAQGLHGRSKICVSYRPKRRDVHDLPRRRTFVRVRR